MKNKNILSDYNRDTFLNNIENFLYRVCFSVKEVDEAMSKIYEIVPHGFNPLRYFTFTPIYAFEKFTHGSDEERIHKTPLFRRDGCVLSVSILDTDGDNPNDTMQGYEIILLDNMNIIAVPGYNIDIETDDKVVCCRYLYLEKNSVNNLKGIFDTDKFILDLTEEVMTSLQLRGCEDVYDECIECPLQDLCNMAEIEEMDEEINPDDEIDYDDVD